MTGPIDYSYLSSSDNRYIDEVYERYADDPDSVDSSWRHFFAGLEFSKGGSSTGAQGPMDTSEIQREFNVFRLIQSYRARGHLLSDTNPVRKRKDRDARIGLQAYDLSEKDLSQKFYCGHFVGLGETTLKAIVDHLESIYCKTIGLEYMHVTNTDARRWLRKEFEEGARNIRPSKDKKKRILQKLNEASVFESFLQTKFVGQKRFSLEGGETTIPALDAIINEGAELGIKEFVIGMAHRGRLNVLANTIGKTYEFIFREFEGQKDEAVGSGDVKYHKGYTSEQKTTSGKDVYVKVMANPSHLEAVNPVAQGYVRAQADLVYDKNMDRVLPIMIHGDAAVAGQGLVYEVAQMSKLKAYQTGGSIHFVINNQIGFTTDFEEGRSSHYCTSIGKVVDAPIFHVNGDDPEAVVFAVELAVKFRQTFKEDIYIDMVCYRKYGHNEGDEPKFTQPHLYKLISKHHGPREVYLKKLLAGKDIDNALAEEMEKDFKARLSDRFNNVKQQNIPTRKQGPHKEWANLRWSNEDDFEESPDTKVSKKDLKSIVDACVKIPENVSPIRKVRKLMEERAKRFENDNIDWAMGELLAYGSILQSGQPVRFTGQDCVRGTFSHRHAAIFDETTSKAYYGLSNLKEGQGEFRIYNSLLSEYAVLGYEYGYSLGTPKSLTIWEAQFGDFANGAQIMIDQFISGAETKWRRMSGLTLLLPHGYEGQGPEHSNARPERFLQLCAEDNMIIVNCTTPAQLFHVLRRQVAWPFRKPLVIFSPKSLLRHPKVVSKVSEFSTGKFQEVIDDKNVKAADVKRVIFCNGKLYYDLLEEQEKTKRKDIALVRLEQIFPLAKGQVNAILKKYKKAEFVWAQEEPENMGAWGHLLRKAPFKDFRYIGRKDAASPAVGHMSEHIKEQQAIITEAFK